MERDTAAIATVDVADVRAPATTSSVTAVSSVVLAAFLLSSSYSLTKIALVDLPPLTIGLIRFSIAGVILGTWVRVIRRHARPAPADIRRLSVGGLLGITLYFAIENIGVNLATASDAALLVAAYPALTALLELIVYRTRTGVQGLVGIALAMAGVCLVVGYGQTGEPYRLLGDVLLVVTGIVFALYNFATRGVVSRYPTAVVLYYQTVAGAAGFLPLALVEYGHWQELTHPLATVSSVLGLTVLCSIMGLGLYAKGLQGLRSSTAVNLLNLVPLFGLVIAAVTLSESVTPLQVMGGLVVIIGVTITSRHEIARPRGEATGPSRWSKTATGPEQHLAIRVDGAIDER